MGYRATMRALLVVSVAASLTMLGACSNSASTASTSSGGGDVGVVETTDATAGQDTEATNDAGTNGSTAPAEPVAALARGLENGGVPCTDVTAESAPAELRVDGGTCLGPDGVVLQLNVFESDSAMVAGRALIAQALQDADLTGVDGVVSGRAMVAGDSELLSPELLERIVAAIGGEIVDLAAGD